MVFDAFIEEYRNALVEDEKKFILWQAMTVASIWGEKEVERDQGRGHPCPVQQDNTKTTMGSMWEAIEAGGQWFVLAFKNFVDAYHLVIMPGDSSLGDHFT